MERNLTCIICPQGCRLIIKECSEREDGYEVSGNRCKRGRVYGISEITNPKRILTSTVKVTSLKHRRLPIRSDAEIPKDMIMECMIELCNVEAYPPIRMGDIIVKDILGTGTNIVASRSINE